MASKYFTDNVDIDNIVATGTENSNYISYYTNFKASTTHAVNKSFKRPNNLGYKINGTDISTYMETKFTYSLTETTTFNISSFTTVTGVIYGGGGGGGGGGGAATDDDGVDTTDAGTAGQTGYRGRVEWFTLNITPNTSMTITIGAGGVSGRGGGYFKGSAGFSGGGSNGGVGGTSSVKVDDTTIVEAMGGRAGHGGQGRSTSQSYTTIIYPTDGYANDNNRLGTAYLSSSYVADAFVGTYGNGAGGGAGGTNGDGKGGGGSPNINAGAPGSGGYAVVWFR
jgi:hypothetical protein